ncbi:hypothetical protein [Paenibacillus marchantiophytorum]|uniref:hypothetical protein n=1 Tax=Paenibacillus marchantiophytorum TaxID=1619310 RepID=UPI001E56F7F0|nr:hypothetical protein [Paenibacillus marchantiophytorum]
MQALINKLTSKAEGMSGFLDFTIKKVKETEQANIKDAQALKQATSTGKSWWERLASSLGAEAKAVVQKIVSGVEHLAKTITHTNPLKLLIAPVPTLLVEVAKEFQVQIQTATIEKQLGSLKQDKTVAQLLDQRAKGTPEEQKWANERLEQIKEAYTELGRSQAAYHMYAKFGNQAYMDEATKEMEAERIKLGQLGIASSFYDENVDVSSFYAGSALLACKYNPTKNDHSEMPQDNVLRSLILTSLSKGNEGEWAIRRLEGSTETNRSELRSYDPNKTVTLEELFRQESDRYTKEQLEEIWNQLSSEERKAISKQFAQNWFKQTLQGIGGEIANGAMTSWESFKEIGGDFHTGLQTRGNKALDSPYDFINWLTLGASGGIQEGLKERAIENWDSTYDFFNWLTVGGIETVKGAINPDKPLSKEHWLASLGVASIVYGGAKGQWGTKLEHRILGRNVVEGTGEVGSGGSVAKESGDVVEETVTYSRVQGGQSKDILKVNEDGTLSLNEKFKSNDLNVSTGKDHAEYFKNKRGDGSYKVEFEVPKWLDELIQENAISQDFYKSNPLNQGGTAPKIVDKGIFEKYNFDGVAYELPSPISEWLVEYAKNVRIVP